MSEKKKDIKEKEIKEKENDIKKSGKVEKRQEKSAGNSAKTREKTAEAHRPGKNDLQQTPPLPGDEDIPETLEVEAEASSPSTKAQSGTAEKNTDSSKVPQRKKKVGSGELTLSGYFKAICSATPPNVPLMDVPAYYKTVNVANAVLDQRALVDFDSCNMNINIPMVQKVREQKKVKVLLSVGGPHGNFQFLNSSGSVDTFYNSLFSHIYQPWGFDGVTFDVQQLDQKNRPYVIEGIRKFKEFANLHKVETLISISARPTFVCPDVDGIIGIWNQLVPVINDLKKDNIIDFIQIMAYNYGSDYDPLKEKGVPVGKPKEMLEYIFNSYANPFESGSLKYDGFDPDKLMLGVLASADTGLKDFVPVNLVNEALQELNQEHASGIGGAMVFNINYDAQKDYEFSKGLLSGK
ncbi:MAG: glycosyl hydrolase family 18 protein [Candidatus Aminicenantes bacterium]